MFFNFLKKIFENPFVKIIISIIISCVIFIGLEYCIYSKFDKMNEFNLATLIKDGGVFIPTMIAIKLYKYFKNK